MSMPMDVVVEPYDTILCVQALPEHTDEAVLMNNAALDDLCRCDLDIKLLSFF